MFKYAIALASLSLCGVICASTPDLPSCDSWRPAASCNYSNYSRPTSYAINRIVCHKVQGSAASAASWFQNCAAGASAHFTFDNNTGYCYQSVYEADVAWHAGNWSTNCNSVGIEHGGYCGNGDNTQVMYNESAIETKSCITYYSVTRDRSHIIGHYEVPGATHTDPAPDWNWTTYMAACGSTPPPANKDYVSDSPACSANWATGTSATDKYGANYRYHSTAAVSDLAQWSIGVTGGTYTVSAWWPAGTNRSTTAPFTLPNGAAVKVNQQVNGGKWNTLGTCSISGTGVTKLSVWTTTGFVVMADAVKYYGP